jgi:hypothetical protein
MISSLLSILIVVGELLLALAIVFAVFLWRVSARRKRQRSAAERLVGKLRSSKNDRLQRVRATLSEKYGLEGEALEEKAQRLVSLEKSLFARFLRAFLGRDDEGVAVLDESVDALVGAYAELVPAGTTEADAAQAQSLQEANAELTAERDRLQEELRQAHESMDAMAREYVSVYRGAGGAKLKGAAAVETAEGDSGEPVSDDVEGSGASAIDPEEAVSAAADASGEPNSDSVDPVPAGEPDAEAGEADSLGEPKSGGPA